MITPAITVTSAIEGLKSINPELSVIPIVIGIFAVLFFSQQFGTKKLGKSFGPIMLIWFSVIEILGTLQIFNYPAILEAFNPYYVYVFLKEFPKVFCFLELFFFALRVLKPLSDLGHCGYKNIKYHGFSLKLL